MNEFKAYRNLASAIINQAIKDRFDAYRQLEKNPDDVKVQEKLDEVDSFFASEWFEELASMTSINAERIRRYVYEG